MEKTVVELFAGVGGFRVGLNHITGMDEEGLAIEQNFFDVIWANQWEPATKAQHAFDCYVKRFGDGNCSNVDIAQVDKKEIPDHTLLVGGFPCQDYSVAHSLSKEKGIEGKKGVLWWQIKEILEVKKPPFVLLENVDRLIKSPSKQRGRDFGIMLRCFYELGYYVEWRVINAADYGMPQRRRRLYIVAYKADTKFGKSIARISSDEVLSSKGIIAKSFATKIGSEKTKNIGIDTYEDVVILSDDFEWTFENCGFMRNGTIWTASATPIYIGPHTTLKDVIVANADAHYYLSDKQKEKYEFLRGSKKIERTAPNGSKYNYSEGAMSPYDDLELPSRTMLTSEGTTNRSSHIIKDPRTDKLRTLTPLECERLNQFPDNWTDTGMPEKRRYFMMGNALVCGVIEKLGDTIRMVIELE